MDSGLNSNSKKADLIAIAKDYIENMLQETQGRKALLMDMETLYMVSLVYSKTQILQKEVFLMCTLDELPQEQLTHLKAIVFCRCTNENLKLLASDIAGQHKFQQYNIFFTNKVESNMLQQLAENDPHNVINQVQEAYLDFQAINPQFFSLEMPSVMPICRKTIREWSEVDHASFLRMTDGLYSALMSLRAQNIKIRYDEGSKICSMLAQELDKRLTEDSQFVEKMSRNSKSGPTTVLVLDRREDPVTPLLNQWTYQAMIHELLGIKNNRVDLRHLTHLADEMKEVTLSCDEDRFFKQIMYSNFGDVANAIHNMVQQFLQTKKSQAQFNTIEDMQRIIENFPEFKKSERNTTKHFTLLEELKRHVDQNQLYDSSEAEQEIVSGPDRKNNHYKAVKSIVEKPDTKDDEAVRLVSLFALRYEHDDKVREFKTMLRDRKVSEEKIASIDFLIEYAGKSQRRGTDLFQEASVFTGAKRFLGSMFGDDVRNVLQQHKSWLSNSILEPFFRGNLDALQYPYFSGDSYDDRTNQYGQQQSLVLFIIGGATFEEAKDVAEFGLNRDDPSQLNMNTFTNLGGPDVSLAPKTVIGQNTNIILGGTAIHNSKSFLQDVAKVNDGRFGDAGNTAAGGY